MGAQPTELETVLQRVEPIMPFLQDNANLAGVSLRIFKEDTLAGTLAIESAGDQSAVPLYTKVRSLIPTIGGTTTTPTGPFPPGNPPNGRQPGMPNPGAPQPGMPLPPLPGTQPGAFPPPPGTQPGAFPPPGTQPGQNPNSKPGSKPSKDDRFVLGPLGSITVLSVNWPLRTDEDYLQTLENCRRAMVFVRGEAEMIVSHSRIHELAAALQQYVKIKGHFPRGTVPQVDTADLISPPPPVKRLSWMVEMLPYVSGGEFKDLPTNTSKTWQESVNLTLGQLVIPQFLANGTGDAPYRIRYPGANHLFAATHYVGIAGVGMDAPYYKLGDPATAAKIGVFGYDRETTPADIKHGLAQTIVLVQVPTDYKSPWIAGGGATVRGVAESVECFKPFVCAAYKGKKGTFAIMADGKVRFLSEQDVSPETFRTLCTINSGKKIENLDAIAPEVSPEAANVLAAVPQKPITDILKDLPKVPDQPKPADAPKPVDPPKPVVTGQNPQRR